MVTGWHVVAEHQLERAAAQAWVVRHESPDFGGDGIDVHRCRIDAMLAQHRAHVADDAPGAFVVGDDVGDDLANLGERGIGAAQQVVGHLGVGEHGCQRLVQLVGD